MMFAMKTVSLIVGVPFAVMAFARGLDADRAEDRSVAGSPYRSNGRRPAKRPVSRNHAPVALLQAA